MKDTAIINSLDTQPEIRNKKMICTCDNCHYTFQSDALPGYCPDCGRETINRRFESKVISAPAVRPATDAEIKWYEDYQAEVAAAADQKKRLISIDSYEMTDDEHNWAMVMLAEHQVPKTDVGKASLATYLHSLPQDPDRAVEKYLTVRKVFTRRIGEDRSALKKAGIPEPYVITRLNDEGETVLVDGLDGYGPALSILYQFKPYDFLRKPTLGNLKKIDLEKIAREPGTGYLQFLLDWESSLG